MWGTSVLADTDIRCVLPVSLDISPDIARAGVRGADVVRHSGCVRLPAGAARDPDRSARRSQGQRRGAGRGIARIPLGRTLVVTQIAVSLVLLVAAGLFVRSLLKLRDVEPGFDPDRVVVFRVTPPVDQQPISVETRRSLYRQLLERAASAPGVDGASASFSGLLSAETWRNAIAVEGFIPRDGVTPRTFANAVTPTYFDVLRIAVLRGRGFTDDDHETAPRVAIVNEAFARQFFGWSGSDRQAGRPLFERSVRLAIEGDDGDRRRHGRRQICRPARRETADAVRPLHAGRAEPAARSRCARLAILPPWPRRSIASSRLSTAGWRLSAWLRHATASMRRSSPRP